MYTYYNLLIACQLEMDARLARAGKSAVGGVIGTRTAELNTAYLSIIRQFGATKGGNKTGELSRRAAGFIADLPFLTMPADAIRHANCLDLLTENVRSSPAECRPLVQLAEAYETTRRQILMTRGFRAVLDPSSVLVSGAVRTLTALGRQELSPAQRLIRRAHRLAAAGPLGYEELLALSRAYRLAGRPGLASHYAARALQCARGAQAALPEPQPARRRLGKAWDKGFTRFWQEMTEVAAETTVRVASGYTGEFDYVDDRSGDAAGGSRLGGAGPGLRRDGRPCRRRTGRAGRRRRRVHRRLRGAGGHLPVLGLVRRAGPGTQCPAEQGQPAGLDRLPRRLPR